MEGSLSASTNYAVLKEKLCNAVKEACAEEEDKKKQDSFEGSGKQGNAQKGKPTLQKCPDRFKVQVLCPMSWKQHDLRVLMDPGMLAAVFDFLSADVKNCFQSECKKSYNKTKLAED